MHDAGADALLYREGGEGDGGGAEAAQPGGSSSENLVGHISESLSLKGRDLDLYFRCPRLPSLNPPPPLPCTSFEYPCR